ncbi:MAG: aldo/keto reductase [Chloroflexi bacterium]|nr:aldo/keto reductase [Chloroflexota bacterium]
MPLPTNAYIDLAPGLRVCRVLNGMWQVSGAHGPIDARKAIAEMAAYEAAGFTTWDLADHYGPAEDFVGEYRKAAASAAGGSTGSPRTASPKPLYFTKWVPHPGRMTRRVVEEAVDVSRRRMGMERLDLLQFHWWEYEDANYLEALKHLASLRDEGKLLHIALTNFDTAHMEAIAKAGVRVVSNQVQYSLVDQRPDAWMTSFCREQGIGLLTYGTMLGGLLSERWLGKPEPSYGQLNTASLQKYRRMIDAWGGWPLFQELLVALKGIAEKHGASIANVGTRAVLDRPAVAGVIIGARLGVAEHREENARVFAFTLDDADREAIAEVTSRGRDLMAVIGDCGDEYRG